VNAWSTNAGNYDKYTISNNVATLIAESGFWRLEGAQACSSFTVLLSAVSYEVGFMDSKYRQWTLTSTKMLMFRSLKPDNRIAVDFEFPLPDLPASSRDDIMIVRRNGNLIEFGRNGQMLDVHFKTNLRRVFEIFPTDMLLPLVFVRQKGDSATMLDIEKVKS
jgi:hypothetical protein